MPPFGGGRYTGGTDGGDRRGPAFAEVVTGSAKVDAGVCAIEPDHTRVRFDVLPFGFTTYDGEVRSVIGTLALDPQNPDAPEVDITVGTDSVTVPNAEPKDERVGACTNPADKRCIGGFEATGGIMRTDFGVKTFAPMIADAVDLDIDAASEKGR